MRHPAYLACLALIATGCLHQIAPLTGLFDDGGPSDVGDAGDAGSTAADGGDAGSTMSDGGDAGYVCDWRDAGNAGSCDDDSQCPSGFYCDYTATLCPDDGFSTLSPGRCLLTCDVTSTLSTPGISCSVNEDCAPQETCVCVSGGPSQPCGPSHCQLIFGDVLCGATFPLPAGCQSIGLPHSPVEACVCAGNTCNPPADGGLPPDAGFVPATP